MKKFFVSMGLAVAGTASIHAAYAPDLGPLSSTKIWNVSATLRGFYDDNYSTANTANNPRGSYGFEVSPQLMLAVPLQQTELGLRGSYALTYYQERQDLGQNPIDQSGQVDLWVDHAFTERWQAKVMDTFVVSTEPELSSTVPTAFPFRVEENYIYNTANITLNTDWTRLFSTSLNYENTVYYYQNSGATIADVQPGGKGASLAGLLNRVHQAISLDLKWLVASETIFLIGSSFDWVNYTGNEPIASNPSGIGPAIYYSDNRNARGYTGYVGAQHNFLPNLNVSVKAGATYADSYNDPNSSPSVSPYADMSAVYTYNPGCYVQLGFVSGLNATDISQVNASNGKLTLYQESSVLSASINHLITPKLLGSLIGTWQFSTYYEGAYNDQMDNYYTLGLNLSYTFNPHFSAEMGYNYDTVGSNINQRGYDRNRVYLGVTAAY